MTEGPAVAVLHVDETDSALWLACITSAGASVTRNEPRGAVLNGGFSRSWSHHGSLVCVRLAAYLGTGVCLWDVATLGGTVRHEHTLMEGESIALVRDVRDVRLMDVRFVPTDRVTLPTGMDASPDYFARWRRRLS